ncbi:MAG: PhoH family protein, partial [Candidatus Omnitrophota bacterium]
MDKVVKLESYQEARSLLGSRDENLKVIEKEFKVKLSLRGEHLKVSGSSLGVKNALSLVEQVLSSIREGGQELTKPDLYCLISNLKAPRKNAILDLPDTGIFRSSAGKSIGPKTKGQREYVEAIKEYDIVFGLGPAGTGKTYLAM